MREYFILGMRLRWQRSEIDAMPEWEREGYMTLVEENMEAEDGATPSGSSSKKSVPKWSR